MMREPEHGPHVQTPIIVMSGFLEQALVERISRRVDAVLVKPFTPEDLRKRIESVLQAAASRKGKS
jgi:DNA-binding response OmpR family regulator